MSDEDLIRLIRQNLAVEDDPSEVTDEDVEAVLDDDSPPPRGAFDRSRKLFVRKIFARLHEDPVRQVEGTLTFGKWLQEEMDKARIPNEYVADTLEMNPSYFTRVLEDDVLPWELSVKRGADMIILFRLHLQGLSQLLNATSAFFGPDVFGTGGVLISDVIPPRQGGPGQYAGLIPGGSGGHLKHLTPNEWFTKVREELTRRQQIELVD